MREGRVEQENEKKMEQMKNVRAVGTEHASVWMAGIEFRIEFRMWNLKRFSFAETKVFSRTIH